MTLPRPYRSERSDAAVRLRGRNRKTGFGENDRIIKFQETHKGGENHGHKNHAKAVKADQCTHQKALLQLCGRQLPSAGWRRGARLRAVHQPVWNLLNYFKNAVFPADRELFAEIMQPSRQKRCQICKSYFVPRAKNQRYCPNCAAVQKRKKAAERQRRKRAVQSQAGFRVQP